MGQLAVPIEDRLVTAPAPPVVVLAKWLSLPQARGWHSHPAGQWITTSRGVLSLETEEGQWFALPGQAIVVGSNVPHDLSWCGTDEVASVYLEPVTAASTQTPPCRMVGVSALLQSLVLALIDEPRPYDREAKSGLLSRLIAEEMFGRTLALFGLPTPQSRSLRLLCRQLRGNPGDPRDIDQWADAIAMSRRTLTRRFREETGLGIAEWRRRARVVRALEMAAQGALIKQIVGATGHAGAQALRTDVQSLVDDAFLAAGFEVLRGRAKPPRPDLPPAAAANV